MKVFLVYLGIGLIHLIHMYALSDDKYRNQHEASTHENVAYVIGIFVGGVLLWPISVGQWLQAFICGIIDGFKESDSKAN